MSSRLIVTFSGFENNRISRKFKVRIHSNINIEVATEEILKELKTSIPDMLKTLLQFEKFTDK